MTADFSRIVDELFQSVPEIRCEVINGRQVWAVHHAGEVRRVRGGRRSAELYARAMVGIGASDDLVD